MSLTVISRFEARRGREDGLRTELEALIEPALDEPGCLGYDVYADPNRPEVMALVERWTSEEGRAAYLASPCARRAAEVMGTLLCRPPEVQYLPCPCARPSGPPG
ncbi:putative quinol monooxygenase [Streptomyces netropsis]|uniref:Quinol monooxygenase YgiN n=1 Tax=Streptomyces netropsis TaxID=55404 RepID=A0A7W7LII0_STRNE|nr:putative quinol monooxygenase [Streptomyces netropsis]MBB4890802.1 quinol monooxygenase YgiN [Streptomyces netropsis]GGR51613.1 hypothetical protein GCM10010219_65850 [Streptomyces netropsis]